MNARDEFIQATKGKKIICAKIGFYGTDMEWWTLPKGYFPSMLKKFLKDIDINYDDGYGSQELYGIILLEKDEWLERYEYDGSEQWVLKKCPTPEQVLEYARD